MRERIECSRRLLKPPAPHLITSRPRPHAGVCGDPWQTLPANSPHGNYFASRPFGGAVRTYTAGSRIRLSWVLTTNHGGWVGFKLCPRTTNLDQGCFDQNPLMR